ncbi:MAG: TolC family protein [Planctomycetaceae bacterium]|jgi:cobalt-zinc-cadmium efflux system outer membrane protein|nr:TolC family protein [Planctomycetaceae bacterium]
MSLTQSERKSKRGNAVLRLRLCERNPLASCSDCRFPQNFSPPETGGLPFFALIFPPNFDDKAQGGLLPLCEEMDKTRQIGKDGLLRRLPWAIISVAALVFHAGQLSAQSITDSAHRNRYLADVPLPHLVSTPAQEPSRAIPAAGIAALPKRSMMFAEIGDLATKNHPGVRQAKSQAEAYRGTWIQAGLKSNPTVGYSAEEMTDRYAGKQGITFSQPVTPLYKRNARQAAVSREYQAANEIYQIQCQKAANDALLTAYRVAFAYRKCLILEELARLSEESRQAGNELLRAGEIGRSQFLDIKILAERTQIALRNAEIVYRTACKELAILLALPEGELIEIADPIETVPPELNETVLLAEIRACSPELRQACAEVEVAKARLRQQHAEAGIDYDTNATIAYNTETKQGEFSLGIAVPVRIFDRNQGNIRRAQSELSAAHRNVERLERLIAQKYERQWGEYRIARNGVLSYQAILSDAREALDSALDAYRRGEYGSHELLEAQRTLSSVRLEHIDSMSALMESQILLRGAFLTGGLDKPGTE